MKRLFLNSTFRILFIAVAAGVFIFLESILFKTTFSNPGNSLESQYNILLFTILLFLSFAAIFVVWAFKNWGYTEKPWVTLFTAYGLPFLAILISYVWLQLENAPLIEGRLVTSFFRATWQPLLYFWQVMILMFSLWLLYPRVPSTHPFQLKDILIGILAGLACGLVNVFIISVISNMTAQQNASLTALNPPSLLYWMTIVLSLSLAPYALEKFFRQVLMQYWQKRYGISKGFWLVAGSFAVLTFQPVLWLPALCSAIVFGVLIQKQHVSAIIIAHAVTNALILFVGWQWVY